MNTSPKLRLINTLWALSEARAKASGYLLEKLRQEAIREQALSESRALETTEEILIKYRNNINKL